MRLADGVIDEHANEARRRHRSYHLVLRQPQRRADAEDRVGALVGERVGELVGERAGERAA